MSHPISKTHPEDAHRKRTNVTLELLYHEIARRLLLKQDMKTISTQTGIRLNTLRVMTGRVPFREILEELRRKTYAGLDTALAGEKRNLRAEIQEHAETSFDRLVVLEEEAVSEGLRANISQDFMDRAGYGKKLDAPVAVQINVGAVDAEIIADALDREKKGRELLLKKGDFSLAKKVEELDHPVVKSDAKKLMEGDARSKLDSELTERT